MSEPRSREFILNKARVYFALHPDYWEAWKRGNFNSCSLCTGVACHAGAMLYCSTDLQDLYFGYPKGIEGHCIEWIKDV